MPAEVIMPALGMAQETGKILHWLKAEGDQVAEGEPLLEVETDKVTVEIDSPSAGTLAGVSAAEGAEVPVGTTIAHVLAAGETLADLPSPPTVPEAETRVTEGEHSAAAEASLVEERRRLASPKARRLARARGIDLDSLAGSGPGGAVVAADIESMPSSGPAGSESPTTDGHGTGPEIGSIWRVMAERMEHAWREVPQFVLTRDVDATALRADSGSGITVTDRLVQHCAQALVRHPRLTTSWDEGRLMPGPGVNIGIAVATDQALLVPVVHDADKLEAVAIAARRREIVESARAGTLRPEDVQGGTFTISNLGMYRVDAFQAIVNAPQAAILAVGRIVERPFAVDGALVIGPVLTLTVTFDHRVVDGARGAEFLDTLATLIEGRAEAEDVA
jgi:pyruvate dehydrogenase E2 component (dihydrolipoamide acetyltransferase)